MLLSSPEGCPITRLYIFPEVLTWSGRSYRWNWKSATAFITRGTGWKKQNETDKKLWNRYVQRNADGQADFLLHSVNAFTLSNILSIIYMWVPLLLFIELGIRQCVVIAYIRIPSVVIRFRSMSHALQKIHLKPEHIHGFVKQCLIALIDIHHSLCWYDSVFSCYRLHPRYLSVRS